MFRPLKVIKVTSDIEYVCSYSLEMIKDVYVDVIKFGEEYDIWLYMRKRDKKKKMLSVPVSVIGDDLDKLQSIIEANIQSELVH